MKNAANSEDRSGEETMTAVAAARAEVLAQ